MSRAVGNEGGGKVWVRLFTKFLGIVEPLAAASDEHKGIWCIAKSEGRPKADHMWDKVWFPKSGFSAYKVGFRSNKQAVFKPIYRR